MQPTPRPPVSELRGAAPPAAVLLFAFLLLAPGFPFSGAANADAAPLSTEIAPGEREMKALAAAWSDRVEEVAFRDGEWMLKLDEEWFAWSHGRLLPEADLTQWEEYAAIPLYRYPLSLPPLATIDDEQAAALRQRLREARERPPRRSEAFLGKLLAAGSRHETEKWIVAMEVAGFTVKVHERLKDRLALVSEELRVLRGVDPDVAAFLKGLREMNGYNYRYVEGTRSRSLHSYGLAVDLIPRSYGGKKAYWMWAANSTDEWWTIPYESRWMVPVSVVEAFERQGFVWGGKWLFFDTMHFEYRPEILLLAEEQEGEPR
jgi:hypothetical protein